MPVLEAEKYLINVLYPNENCTTFDDLRYVLYTGKNKSITELPSTSKSSYGHLQRCHYLIKLCSNLLNSNRKNMNPISYGWIKDNTMLVPDKCHSQLPDRFIVTSGSKIGCTSGNCSCKLQEVWRTEYCKCFKYDCKNK